MTNESLIRYYGVFSANCIRYNKDAKDTLLPLQELSDNGKVYL